MPNPAPLQILPLRLTPGDDLRAALQAAFAQQQALHGVQAACVMSALGSLSQAVLRYAAAPQGTLIAQPLELIALSGTLGAGGLHLHASVADAWGVVRGGHVMPGCTVRTTAEIVLALLPGWVFDRQTDAATGFKELVLSRTGWADLTGPAARHESRELKL